MEMAVAGAADLGRYGRRIVKMIWDPEPTNNTITNQPVWCLGCSYTLDASRKKGPESSQHGTPPDTSPNTPPPEADPATTRTPAVPPDTPPDSASSSFSSSLAYEEYEGAEGGGWPVAFLDDFESKFWMTYRSGFQPIPRSADPKASAALSLAMRLKSLSDQNGFSSDSGWGCMIRSGQSLLANALATIKLGRDWRHSDGGLGEKEIVSLFSDDPRAPFSIHRFVGHGEVACGKYPGEWFGPSATARCIQALVNAQAGPLRVYATGDLPDVYEDSFFKIARPGPGDDFCPTLILVGTRLGIDKVNTVYWEALTSALQMPQSVGIAGGRPASSHYFVGTQRSSDDQGSFLFYLDPHHTRAALPFHDNPADYTQPEVDSCHTRRLRRLHIREMDPSMLIGFLIRDEDDWDSWKGAVKHVQGKVIITVSAHDPAGGMAFGRREAIDEVETLSDDDDDDDDDTETVLYL
ncbi:cysteine protease ATG4 [Niveomyces insectorum RCEF 264]|uniref:Cysteine protease n=1 Tax=Niveomyces insectorum RCEF 264 TaxID=1081102 RepID=A0A167MKW5_9HYPO|nr:cysteine protease ATG4 [Niveomyces insectorum RCEF 264]